MINEPIKADENEKMDDVNNSRSGCRITGIYRNHQQLEAEGGTLCGDLYQQAG
jgi:hypothetical protein